MLDFLKISTRASKTKGTVDIYPKFIIKRSSDLMIRGGDFYAVWLEDKKLWSTDEEDLIRLIDKELSDYTEQYRKEFDNYGHTLYLWDSSSGMIDSWHKYCQKQMRDNFHMLDESIIFSNHELKKDDYASKTLSYPLESGEYPSYEQLVSTLYSEEERHKIEWAIGSIVSGDSKQIQKFLVLYGAAGTGKSTILNIIQQLFDGYYTVFDAKALGSSNNSFSLEPFKNNPLVAIQHDGDLSKIEDNTRLNSLVSHEQMTVNEKFKSTYANRFKCFLFMGTNKPVKITDGKSGIIRRLIDVTPTGNRLSPKDYKLLTGRIKFELGAIASHCLEVYKEDPGYYDDYIPVEMLGASNDFYNFVIDSYSIFEQEDGISLKQAWDMYKAYCDEAKVGYPYSKRLFKEELKNYFAEYADRINLDGSRIRSYFSGFRKEKFAPPKKLRSKMAGIIFDAKESLLDKELADCPAQYATANEIPSKKWNRVSSKLRDLDTSELHYVRVPENHIVIDFDIPNKDGQKDLKKNIAEASKWPPTYAELSKSGKGVHLHYIYDGDPTKLSTIYSDHIEIKVFTGNSALRRKLTKCNSLPVAHINSGLPLKEESKVINFESIKDEGKLRTLIKKCLNKEVHANTKSNVDFIAKLLDEAYNNGLSYDISDMYDSVLGFCAGSTNQSDYCLRLLTKMHFKSDDHSDPAPYSDDRDIVFFDCEVFPNLFLVNWKVAGDGKKVVRMINPTPSDMESLFRMKLVGFNCRRYDNHMLYARYLGYNNQQLYQLSQDIITEGKGFFGEAYNVSYTDILDFSSKKQSLKKFEIELGIHHQELGLPWDQPVPEDQWVNVAEYCDNDVFATEAVFNARQADFIAREILADLTNSSLNDTTNTLSERLIFGRNKHPQDQFNYRFMGDVPDNAESYLEDGAKFDKDGKPWFPGYEFKFVKIVTPNGKTKTIRKSLYRGEEVGEGGYVYAEPGMYRNVALLDVASMHPSSIIAENLFGDIFTARFRELRDARIAIKHKAYNAARTMLEGKIAKHITRVENGEISNKDLAGALKIVINAIYGLTAASFENPCRDPRNVDNIVAKRGALFMVDLKHAVQDKGFTVVHIKTDSIKIADATPDVIDMVMEIGKKYGYTFEHEATYDRICLVNDAVYIASYDESTMKMNYGDDWRNHTKWTATGAQFQKPYVFKSLFSHEQIVFDDMCETKEVKNTAIYLGDGYDDKNPSFVGRVGLFCPMKNGKTLLRQGKTKTGEIKYDAITGTKGYSWLEAETVKNLNLESDIDKHYYINLCNEAKSEIMKYGDYEWFVS